MKSEMKHEKDEANATTAIKNKKEFCWFLLIFDAQANGDV